ncbi:hypothetical protein Kpol_1066p5 [Vanderwaltozyma polyspora DSM 70294]|uniref:Uncharacterized protein n=1 Tax=Vanderwaltozyma polyspora (strain ATCC 22028 / DSM 70294 / BCRC 21397 / CBS 2163 / NBRC 10782 / NRRL Y-8283 / UCD 57-17) TaxID=436907 RepID=A7TMM7_VANPO|nr:uncharacterized protein Kpol_1066p5 [Vanderwaltozyma polyspora DSM 70294]EDO16441.1 hypothetical protein Kpol_1066p5 [Vanderwaltozyma polyspora DSM 70294]
MPIKKRPRSGDGKASGSFKKPKKTYQVNEQFTSQDIWKSLDRIRKTHNNVDSIIPNSSLFVVFYPSFSKQEVESCVSALFEYIDSSKVKIHEVKNKDNIRFISITNFSILDCSLILTVLFIFKNKKWVAPNNYDYFQTLKDININGSFYIPNSTLYQSEEVIDPKLRKSSTPFVKSIIPRYQSMADFIECSISSTDQKSVSSFINEVTTFFSRLKYSKKVVTSRQFKESLEQHLQKFELQITEMFLKPFQLFDTESVTNNNSALIESSKNNLSKYIENLKNYNENTAITKREETASQVSTTKRTAKKQLMTNNFDQSKRNYTAASTVTTTIATNTTTSITTTTKNPVSRYSNNEYSPANNTTKNTTQGDQTSSHRPNFMTQEEIKDHCLATIKASIDLVKSKSPYQILRAYVKCPRQNYIDLIYQHLNELRSSTNCNIVILHLNNLHEAQPWFNSLDISKYTNFSQQPHQTTVRIISIGGVGEHILNALDQISNILN